LDRQIGGIRAGSSGYVYSLGAVGHRLLHPDRTRRRLHEVRDGFLQHTLAIAELYVSLRQRNNAVSSICCASKRSRTAGAGWMTATG
jgi:hypothetical protein